MGVPGGQASPLALPDIPGVTVPRRRDRAA